MKDSTAASFRLRCAAALIVSMGVASSASAACQMLQLAELTVTLQNRMPLVPVVINGESAKMLLDTSYTRTQISAAAAQNLHLKLRPSDGGFFAPDGSLDGVATTVVGDFTFAGSTTHQRLFWVTGQAGSVDNVVGVIGQDILGSFDVEFDLASNTVRFFAPKDCKGDQVAYWAHEYSVVDLTRTFLTKLPLIEVTLNDRKVLATFSFGIPQSTVTSQAAQRSGIEALPGKPAESSAATFPTLTIGQEALRNARLTFSGAVGRYGLQRFESQAGHAAFENPDLELGGDFFVAHRIYFAQGQGKVYFTYNGGPIFQSAGSR